MNKPFQALSLPIDKDLIIYADFIKELTDAESCLGAFNQKIQQSKVYAPHAHNHLLKLESLYSTRIEGTQTTIDEIFESEIDTSDSTLSKDELEVKKYNDALIRGVQSIVDGNPITNKLLKEIHEILLSNGARKTSNFQPGEFRTQQNRVGDHVPPIASEVLDLMSNLEKYINADSQYGDQYDDNLVYLLRVAIIHAQFETIHPFPDGNGRVGRILIPLYLIKKGKISSPYFFLSQTLEKNKIKYYNYLQGTRTKTAKGYTNWFKFFLQSVADQAKSDLMYISQLESLYKTTLDKAKKIINSSKIETIIGAMFESPVFTTDTIYKKTGIAKNTLREYFKRLLDEEILFSNQMQIRNRRYYLHELLSLLGQKHG